MSEEVVGRVKKVITNHLGVTDDKVVLTFLEVYNEKAYDLLAPTRTQLATRSDAGGGCRVLFVS